MDPALEARLKNEASSFDLRALVDVLLLDGYSHDQIELRSHRSMLHQGALIHSVELRKKPERRAVVTLNVGLLAIQSPLPSFFLALVDQLDQEPFAEFIAWFDDRLLKDRLAGLFPEREEGLLPGWEAACRDRLRLLRMTSPSTLHWLFRLVYPELEVTVRRGTMRRRVRSEGILLGTTILGEGAAMGGYANVPTGGFEVTLYGWSELSAAGVPWAVEAPRRLQRSVLPLLGDVPFHLRVVLTLRDQAGFAHLEAKPEAPPTTRLAPSYLGYDPLIDNRDEIVALAREQEQHVVLFNAQTAEL